MIFPLFVIPKRFERLTHALEGRCSIQLSYGTYLKTQTRHLPICECKDSVFISLRQGFFRIFLLRPRKVVQTDKQATTSNLQEQFSTVHYLQYQVNNYAVAKGEQHGIPLTDILFRTIKQ